MARYVFNLPTVQATQTVRLDTALGSDSPASGLLAVDGTAIGSTLTADHIGFLPEVQGPDGVSTLYVKVLAYGGAVTGTPVAVTGLSQQAAPSSPGGSSPVAPNATIDTTTYDNVVVGDGSKFTTVVLPANDGVLVVAIEGDAYPRMIVAANPANTLGITMGDGTIDPYNNGAAYGSFANADGVTLPNVDNSAGQYYGISTGDGAGITFYNCTGTPQGKVPGNVGDICFRQNPSGANTTIYRCTGSGTSTTATWTGIV